MCINNLCHLVINFSILLPTDTLCTSLMWLVSEVAWKKFSSHNGQQNLCCFFLSSMPWTDSKWAFRLSMRLYIFPHSITEHVNFCPCMNLLLNILINKKNYAILYLNISLDLGGCLNAFCWLCGLKIKKILLIAIILTIMILLHLDTKLFLSRATECNP